MANEKFLGRWARLKRDARSADDSVVKPGDEPGQRPAAGRDPAQALLADMPPSGGSPDAGAPDVAAAVATAGPIQAPLGQAPLGANLVDAKASERSSAERPSLPSIDSLTKDSDFSMFMGSDVDPGTRVSALKKLFSDPHFNRMDGLDVYIDDYSKPDPIPLAMLKRLAHGRLLNLFDEDESEDGVKPVSDAALDADPMAESDLTAGVDPIAGVDAAPAPAQRLASSQAQAAGGTGEGAPDETLAASAPAVRGTLPSKPEIPEIPETPEQPA